MASEAILIARMSGAKDSSRVYVGHDAPISVELDPASGEGTFTGATEIQHLVNDVWHSLYVGGSKVTLTSTNTRVLLSGPLVIRASKAMTSVAVGVSVRKTYHG